jgi:two-component system, OmpR family, sensor histidine kinase KdpD
METANKQMLFDENFESEKSKKGNLRIFLGYCAGVGKTYKMLQEGIASKEVGIDVVIGIAETHGRKETEALANILEVVPRKKIEYLGIGVSEMDLDAILARRPQLVLVDELAHNNIPGSRHTKRYQDVEELLNSGINVYTTLNIQHVQSLVDIIFNVTAVKVEEIVPDRILQMANEIELVDLTPEKLQQRFLEGKVYIPQKAKQAMQKFFRKGNLLALRELSLKYTAKRVDVDLNVYREKEEIVEIWPLEPRLMVSIGAGKIGEKLLLTAHRMASDLKADWYAVHVESPQQVKISDRDRNQLYKNIRLAEELGAKVVYLSSNIIADEIIRFAKEKNVTLIIAGLSDRSKTDEVFKGTVLDKLVRKSSPINVLVVGASDDAHGPKTELRKAVSTTLNWKAFLTTGIGLVIFTLIGLLFSKHLSAFDVLLLMFFPVAIAGVTWGARISLMASFLAVGLIDFFFIPPRFSFAMTDFKYFISFAIFIFVAVATSFSGRYLRWKARSSKYREKFIYALFSFERELMVAHNLDEVFRRAVKNIAEAFDSEVTILLPSKEEKLEIVAKSKPQIEFSPAEQAVAMWVYKNGKTAGSGTSTLSSAKWYYLPVKMGTDTLGVISVLKSDPETGVFTPEQKRLLESFGGVVALSLSKVKK